MNANRMKRLNSSCRDHAVSEVSKKDLRHGMEIYRRFNSFNPSRVMKIKYHRVIPPVVVELGQLVGLIYRSDKWQRHRSQTFIHLMDDPPTLVSDVNGTQLYIIGGSYRVTHRGIEG
jgi:hypothetical protein